jgi:hypothetical protein
MAKHKFLYAGLTMLVTCVAHADVLGLSNPAEIAGYHGYQAYVAGNFFAGSDYIPVKQYSGNWGKAYAPRDGMNLAISSGRLESGVSWDTWRLAALYREDFMVESNMDTTNLAYYNKQGLPVPSGKAFNVNLKIQGFDAEGIRLDKGMVVFQDESKTISFGAGLSLLHGLNVRIADANGMASSNATGYSYNVTAQDAYSNATYPFISNGTPTGQGYALNIGTRIDWASGMYVDISANDLLGMMSWQNMPYTIETLNSVTLTRDANGQISYNPTINGINDIHRRTINQRLPTKLHAEWNYPLSDMDLTAGSDWISGFWLPQMGLTKHFGVEWKASMDYDIRFKTVGLRASNKQFYINVRSSSFDLGSANAFGIDFGISHEF